ncbi:MAG TPA: cupin domain-containing protein [Actinomycetota bacterium]|nr:cupin domain-containing protein [Actinomycetota bacterium]
MTAPALERCVGDVRTFAEEHWGRRPLLHRSGPAAFASLLELTDVDRLITETLLRMPAFRLVKDGQTHDPKTYTQTIRIGGQQVERTVRPDKVADLFEDGATIVLQALHRQSGEIATLCRGLELALTHPVQANAYVTPPGSQGFAIHHDTHDVFVVQTHGRKAWRVYGPLVELAGSDQPWKKELGDPGAPMLEAELEPGDVLYIPRGFPHDAEAREGVSVHVTIGILASTWVDVWKQLLRRLSEHRPFRDPLPVGYADAPERLAGEVEVRRKELHDWLDRLADEELLSAFAERFWRARRPLASGRLAQLEELDAIEASTPVRRRPEGVFRVEVRDDRATVLLGLRELRMPASCEAALRFVAAATGPFAARDLPGLGDEASGVVLVRRLVREGALEVVRAPG